MTEAMAHWETVYATKDPTQVSWYQPHATLSLDLIRRWTPTTAAGILDVGGGASTLVDDLLAAGYAELTVLDVSNRALEAAQQRLGDAARRIRWLVADITRVELPSGSVALWHDRAVFHFLIEAEARGRYVEALRRALPSGGSAIIATFAPDGPTHCSGLEVARYSADGIVAALGTGFTLIESALEVHVTPGGGEQRFVYAVCRKA